MEKCSRETDLVISYSIANILILTCTENKACSKIADSENIAFSYNNFVQGVSFDSNNH